MVESGASRGQALSVTDPECEETDLCCLGLNTASPWPQTMCRVPSQLSQYVEMQVFHNRKSFDIIQELWKNEKISLKTNRWPRVNKLYIVERLQLRQTAIQKCPELSADQDMHPVTQRPAAPRHQVRWPGLSSRKQLIADSFGIE